MTALTRKLLRELLRLKGQVGSIALVVATGIMTVVTMRGGYESLVDAQRDYYRQTRFADVWVSLERAPESVRGRLEAVPGVAAVETRVTLTASLDLAGLDVTGTGLLVSVPDRRRPRLNDVHVTAGRYLAAGGHDEILVSQNFARARGLEPGDSVRAVIDGRARDLAVVGVAISPEHAYTVPPGSLFPEDDRFGVLWMSRDRLGPAYDMEGAFNEAVLALAPEADTAAVLARVDRLLEPYGGTGAYLREDQPSHQILQSELDQNRVMGTAVPAVFLGVAAFLLHMVLGRLIATQRTDIGVLKAFGYRDREVGGHYLLFAMAAVAVGTILGVAAGLWMGGAYLELYGEYFHFPDLRYRLSWTLVLLAASVSGAAAVAGALAAVRSAAALPPAEAMRPEPPPRFRPGLLERSGVGRLLRPPGRMILRNLERRPVRAFLSALGVAFSVAILVVGLLMQDGVRAMMDLQFRVAQREDLTVTFERPLEAGVRHALERLEGVTRVEPFRGVGVRLRAGHRSREVALQGVPPDARLRRIVSADGDVHPLPASGAVLSAILAEDLGVTVGDVLAVEVLEGRRERGSVTVAGVVDDLLGVSAWMDIERVRRLAGEPPVVSGAHLSVMRGERGAVSRRLGGMPAVVAVASPADVLASFEEQLAESFLVVVGFLVGFASIIAVAVIYNGARIALSERGRELGSLRVLGLRRQEVAVLLLGEQAVVTLVAIPLGWMLGWLLSLAVVSAMETENFRIPLVAGVPTYAVSALVTLAAAGASAWLVRRRIDRMELVAVLKTRE